MGQASTAIKNPLIKAERTHCIFEYIYEVALEKQVNKQLPKQRRHKHRSTEWLFN